MKAKPGSSGQLYRPPVHNLDLGRHTCILQHKRHISDLIHLLPMQTHDYGRKAQARSSS